MLRIVLLLVLAWMTLLIFNAGMIVIPISLGRLVFEAVPRLPITHGIKCNGNLHVILLSELMLYNLMFTNNEISCITSLLTPFGILSDLFSFSIGCYILWSVAAGTRYAIDYIRSRQLGFLVQQICKWCSVVLKSSFLLSIWVILLN